MPVRMDSSSVAIDMTSRGDMLPALSPGKQRKHQSEEFGDSRFDNSLSPEVMGIDQSRSPSMGDTFISAATDGPLSSSDSDSDSSDDDDGNNDLEQGRIGPIGSPSLNSNHNSATAFDQLPSLPFENSVGEIRPLSPGEGPSGSTSISVSMGSNGNVSIEPTGIKLDFTVRVVGEKRGLFLKQSEYEIEAEPSGLKVRRSYKDFEVLHGYLLEKYPYRMIPALPPKTLMLQTLLEQRRNGLQTWLTVIANHPVLTQSQTLDVFLNDVSPEYEYRMKVAYEKQVDEFGRLRKDVKIGFPDAKALTVRRTQLIDANRYLTQLGKLFDEQAFRSQEQQRSLAEVDEILQSLEIRKTGQDSKIDFANISQTICDVSSQIGSFTNVQRTTINERINAIIGLLDAHHQLIERVMKGVYAQYKRSVLIEHSLKSRPNAEGHDEHTGNNLLPDLRRKCIFAWQCMVSETSLAERYLQTLPDILFAYAREASQHHDKMSKTWHRLEANESASKM